MAKQIKVPKRIVGLKVPKQVRKGTVGEFLGSRAGQVIVAAVLVEAGVLLAKLLDPATKSGRGLRHALTQGADALFPAGAGKGAKKIAKQRMTLLSNAFERAIDAFRAAMDGAEQEDLRAAVTDVTPSEDVGKKRRSTSRHLFRH